MPKIKDWQIINVVKNSEFSGMIEYTITLEGAENYGVKLYQKDKTPAPRVGEPIHGYVERKYNKRGELFYKFNKMKKDGLVNDVPAQVSDTGMVYQSHGKPSPEFLEAIERIEAQLKKIAEAVGVAELNKKKQETLLSPSEEDAITVDDPAEDDEQDDDEEVNLDDIPF